MPEVQKPSSFLYLNSDLFIVLCYFLFPSKQCQEHCVTNIGFNFYSSRPKNIVFLALIYFFKGFFALVDVVLWNKWLLYHASIAIDF